MSGALNCSQRRSTTPVQINVAIPTNTSQTCIVISSMNVAKSPNLHANIVAKSTPKEAQSLSILLIHINN